MDNQKKNEFIKKEITLPDGRYLIYYDFNKEDSVGSETGQPQEENKNV